MEIVDPPPEYFSYLCDRLEDRLITEGFFMPKTGRIVIEGNSYHPDDLLTYTEAAEFLECDRLASRRTAIANSLNDKKGLTASGVLKLKLLPKRGKGTAKYTLDEMIKLFGTEKKAMARIYVNGLFKPPKIKKGQVMLYRKKQKEVFFDAVDVVLKRRSKTTNLTGDVNRDFRSNSPDLYLAQCIEDRIKKSKLYDPETNKVNLPGQGYLHLDSLVGYEKASELLGVKKRNLLNLKLGGNPLMATMGRGLKALDVLALYLVEASGKRVYSYDDVAKVFGCSTNDIYYLKEEGYFKFNSRGGNAREVMKKFGDSYTLVVNAFRAGKTLLTKLTKVNRLTRDQTERYIVNKLTALGISDLAIGGFKTQLLSCRIVDIYRSDLDKGRIVYRDGYDLSLIDAAIERYVTQRGYLMARIKRVPKHL